MGVSKVAGERSLGSQLDAMPRREVLTDSVHEAIQTLIMNRAVAPGGRINIDELARELRVSGAPVRESLVRLESEGLVTRLPMRGYRVADLLTEREITELYELRLLLEPPGAAKAAANMTSELAARLRDELATCPEAPDDGNFGDYKALTLHDARLHEQILRIAGNGAMLTAFARTHCHLHFFRLFYNEPFGVQTIEEHADLVDALISGKRGDARAAMAQHLEAARDRILGRL